MRRAYCATFFAMACLVFAQSSRAQVTFIAGPQRSVARGPAYIATADFNGDGIQDAAVSSTLSPVVTVLFGSPDGGFESVVNVPVGTGLRGITTADFNGDGVSDIAVADETGRRIFVIPTNKVGGKGNGTFGTPASFSASNGLPIDIAAGNLDFQDGLDLVTSNRVNRLSLWFNDGKRGFQIAAAGRYRTSWPLGCNGRLQWGWCRRYGRADHGPRRRRQRQRFPEQRQRCLLVNYAGQLYSRCCSLKSDGWRFQQ